VDRNELAIWIAVLSFSIVAFVLVVTAL